MCTLCKYSALQSMLVLNPRDAHDSQHLKPVDVSLLTSQIKVKREHGTVSNVSLAAAEVSYVKVDMPTISSKGALSKLFKTQLNVIGVTLSIGFVFCQIKMDKHKSKEGRR